MATNIKGRNVVVEVAGSTGMPVSMVGVAKALDPLVSAPSHSLVEWSAATMQGVTGMKDLEGQGVIVCIALDANSFHAKGLDTRSYRGGNASGYLLPVTSWLTLAECTSYELSETSGSGRLNTTTIQNDQSRSRPALLPQQALTLEIIAQTMPSAALKVLQAARLSRTAVLLRITHKVDGSLRVCSGDPTFPSESVSVGAMGSGDCVVNIDGLFLSLAGPFNSPTPPTPPSGGDYYSEDYHSEDYFG